MATIEFDNLEFFPQEDGVKAVFLKHYTFHFSQSSLKLSKIKITRNTIESEESEKALNNAVSRILNQGLGELVNTVSGRKTIYIHQGSGIPLIGTNSFGIVDRNTNCIEIKPLTGCNLNCIYCSVDEGSASESKKSHDYIVDKDYLIAELSRLVEIKKDCKHGIEIHIGPQGEPLLYPDLAGLIEGIANIPKIKRISMDTNGLLLSKKLIDELVAAGLSRFNISLNSLTKDICNRLSNRNYNIDHLKNMIRYIDDEYASKGKCELILAPVLLAGFNDSDKELDALIEYSKSITGIDTGIKMGMQNFLNYKGGRNPVKEKGWEEFYALLERLEKKHSTRLILRAEDFHIEENNVLKRPFRKDEVVSATIVCPGQYKSEKIAAAKGRAITVYDCAKDSGTVKLRIVRDKHNIFDAVQLR